ncbi:MAG: hypothetical protein DMF69_22805 [Acidobacteria bacterium]|nr:MAG: hypothetical protein DMF69_22805 [Acidobacteriota bacterium]
MSKTAEVENLAQEVRTIGDSAKHQFGKLSRDQLNWKPAPDRWSVAQCFDHLITTNVAYFPIVESIAKGEKRTTLVERLPVLPKLWAKLFIKSLDPKATRKLKAPASFQPSASYLSESIIDDFVDHQRIVAESMDKTKDLNLDRVVITSPAAPVITYSLMDAFRILVIHEQRHFQQAKRVTEDENFPK